MINDLDNPFSVTKATEFTDDQINEYWVKFNTKENVSIDSILNPSELLAKYVIGGKGCGKTHILRYFSYPLQKIRHQNNITELLSKDKYIGLYSVLHGLNSSRFIGKDISNEAWKSIFEYYFELYVCDGFLHTIKEIFNELDIDGTSENALTQSILKIFNSYDAIKDIKDIDGIIEFLKTLRRKIDTQILNAAFTRELDYSDVTVLFSPGDLIFGIPGVISKEASFLKETKFIFIFDEYEKLFEWQKVFINTLVWDKKSPVTFWIGARRYGYTTRQTKSGEFMKDGSEYQEVNLDLIIRSNEDLYKEFAKELCLNRLIKYYESKGMKNINRDEVQSQFYKRFESYNEKNLLNQITEKNKKKESKHIKELRKKILKAIEEHKLFDLKDPSQIDLIIEKILEGTNNEPLEQKYKIFRFYQLWYRPKTISTLNGLLEQLNKEYSNTKDNTFKEIKDKRKKDFLAQLIIENNLKNTEYLGIDKFIDLSQGNARTFILILKKVIEFSRIRGEKPFEEGACISLDTQYLAVYDTAKWFYDDAELYGESGKYMYNSLKNLADYLALHRFCDKPTDTTVSCFYVKSEELSSNTKECLNLMTLHSIIIEDDDGRKEKNTGRKENLYQLNKILSPLWNLPIVERGSLHLNKAISEAIFDCTQLNTFPKIYEDRKNDLNAPDFIKSKNSKKEAPTTTNLFE